MKDEHVYRRARSLYISHYAKLSSPKRPLRFFEPQYQDFSGCENEHIITDFHTDK